VEEECRSGAGHAVEAQSGEIGNGLEERDKGEKRWVWVPQMRVTRGRWTIRVRDPPEVLERFPSDIGG
jgi:hypothetical protein